MNWWQKGRGVGKREMDKKDQRERFHQHELAQTRRIQLEHIGFPKLVSTRCRPLSEYVYLLLIKCSSTSEKNDPMHYTPRQILALPLHTCITSLKRILVTTLIDTLTPRNKIKEPTSFNVSGAQNYWVNFTLINIKSARIIKKASHSQHLPYRNGLNNVKAYVEWCID